MHDQDTIFALATGLGRAAIAIVRLSGTATGPAVTALAGSLPAPRYAGLRRLRDAAGELLDEGLVLWMPGPASYTGEDAAELHIHAGPAVVDGVAGALVAQGLRPAEPGEFTRRAFINNRFELTEAEAVADLIEAETAAQRRQALAQKQGGLARRFDGWAACLKAELARQEALIDFPEDTEQTIFDPATLNSLIAELALELDDDQHGERLRRGLEFAVTGPPNVGKSSLINVLAGRDASIVSPVAGTTRDVLEIRTIFGGVPVTLLDTAGLRDSIDPIEVEGIRRARARAVAADLVLCLHEAGTPAGIGPHLHIATKIDLTTALPGSIGISTHTGAGVAALRARLDAEATRLTTHAGPPPLTRSRHRAACRDAHDLLREARTAQVPELRAEATRLALRALGRVTGRVGVEDVLDAVFSQFCIGK